MNPQPLTLEYQSRIIKAKKLATGGLMLLGGALAVISPLTGLAMFARLSGSAISFSPTLLAAIGMMLIAIDGILLIVCSVLILRNHMPAVQAAKWLIYFLFLPVAVYFYAVLSDRFTTQRNWNNVILLAVCCLQVCGGLVAVLVELSIVRKALLQGDYPSQPAAKTLRPDPPA